MTELDIIGAFTYNRLRNPVLWVQRSPTGGFYMSIRQESTHCGIG